MEQDRSRAACRKAYEERKDIMDMNLSFTAFYASVNQLGWDYDLAARHPVSRKGIKKRPRGTYNPSDFSFDKKQ